MKIKFVEMCEIELYEDGSDEGESEVFIPGQIADVEIIGHPDRWDGNGFVPALDLVNLRFANGLRAGAVSKAWFTEVGSNVETTGVGV